MGVCQKASEAAEFAQKCEKEYFFFNKRKRANELTDTLCSGVKTKTANALFDRYCELTFLDNVLRGGYPITLGNKTFYIYWRKHGDTERDYNDFFVSPEYLSQGNANFRDLNQNRRNDCLFFPFTTEHNIKLFWNLTAIDGTNPLKINGNYFVCDPKKVQLALNNVPKEKQSILQEFLKKPFSPGALVMLCERHELCENPRELAEGIIVNSRARTAAEFGEGFWIDHFSYNLDLVENYLAVWCDKGRELLVDDCSYTFFVTGVRVLPREQRYIFDEDKNAVRQYRSIEKLDGVECDQLKTADAQTVKVNLLVKILSVIAIKLASLDSEAMGVEMESGKPGWNDALNGLPAHFGSSTCETCELYRLINFALYTVRLYTPITAIPQELYDFICDIDKATAKLGLSQDLHFEWWNTVNNAKEHFREKTARTLNGSFIEIKAQALEDILLRWQSFVRSAINRAAQLTREIFPTYFSFEMDRFSKEGEKIVPKGFSMKVLPSFLEGVVHYLKTEMNTDEKRKIYQAVKGSNLYDKKLKMYKLNESLAKQPFSIGRARAFTPGWLENESVWLHMEYKYMLELLRGGLYKEFFDDAKNVLVPFMDKGVYGRSTLENSTFIASSEYPDSRLHGRGFVARLTGATAEFLSMWNIMMFGKTPFVMENGVLTLRLCPALPDYLIGESKTVSAMFLGKTLVTYHFDSCANYFPGEYTLSGYSAQYDDKSRVSVNDEKISGKTAHELRKGRILALDVWINKK